MRSRNARSRDAILAESAGDCIPGPTASRRSSLWRPVAGAVAGPGSARPVPAADLLKDLQTHTPPHAREAKQRAYHFGSQRAGRRLLQPRQPLQPPGAGLRLRQEGRPRRRDRARTAGYRDPEKIKAALRGPAREHPRTPQAVYADQSDLYRVQKEASPEGPSMCSSSGSTGSTGPPPRPRRSPSAARSTPRGRARGWSSRITPPSGSAQYGFVVTSPTHDSSVQDVDRQLVTIPPDSLGGGYDARIAGPNPWTLGPLGPQAPGYLKGQSANEEDRAGVAVGRPRPPRLHRLVAERRGARQRGQVVQQRAERRRRQPPRHDPLPRAPGPGLEGRHGHQRPVLPRLARRHVRPERGPRRLPGHRPGHARAPRASSRRRGRRGSIPGLDVVIGTGYGIRPRPPRT